MVGPQAEGILTLVDSAYLTTLIWAGTNWWPIQAMKILFGSQTTGKLRSSLGRTFSRFQTTTHLAPVPQVSHRQQHLYIRPDSSLFLLPALTNPERDQWMKTTCPLQLDLANVLHRDAVHLECIYNELLRQSLKQILFQSSAQNDAIRALELPVSQLNIVQ